MSGLLLDTNVFLWFVSQDARLKPEPYARIEAAQEQVCLSCVSAWEIAIKVGLGKLKLDRPLEDLMGEPLMGHGIELLPISREDVLAYSSLPIPEDGHRDPFDRMLVVQAKNRQLRLLTSDPRLKGYDLDLEVV